MTPEQKKNTAARVLKAVALLTVIVFAAVSLLLLFALVPMLLFGGDVQLDSGGFLDLLLRRTQHATGMLPALHVFLGALPMLLNVLLLLADSIVLFSFLRQAVKRGVWLFPAGIRYWIAASVIGTLIAVVPKLTSVAVTPTINAGGVFAVRPWNPLGGILLLAVTLAVTTVYAAKRKRPDETAA